jgi:hypothetical protein
MPLRKVKTLRARAKYAARVFQSKARLCFVAGGGSVPVCVCAYALPKGACGVKWFDQMFTWF